MPQDLGDGLDLVVVALNGIGEFQELRDEFARRRANPPHPHEGPHDGNVHLHRPWRAEDAGQHRHAVLGKDPGELALTASAGL